LESMRATLAYSLNDLYGGIITYENDVLATPLPLYLVNQLESTKQDLDLTQLIAHMTLHATDFFDYKSGKNVLEGSLCRATGLRHSRQPARMSYSSV
jgi:hypothetical protein